METNFVERVHELIIVEISAGRHVSMSLIANTMGISVRCLQRKYRKINGGTPKKWAVVKRAEMVAEALIGTKPTKNLANEFGYSDMAHLANQFRLIYGLSPRKFRDRFRSTGYYTFSFAPSHVV